MNTHFSFLRLSSFTSRAGAVVALSGLLADPRPVAAAGITFGPPTTIVGDNDVYIYGGLRYAYNQANASSTVNGVAFAGATSTTTLGGGNVTMSGYTGGANTTAFGSGAGAPWNTLSAAYQIVLRGGSYTAAGTPAVDNLNNLTSGHQYAVQFWVNDNRSCCFTRTETVAGGNNTVSLAYNAIVAQGGVGQYSLGYFTAAGTTQSLTNSSAASSQMNAIQLRDVTGTWSGTASGDWDNGSANFSGLSYSGVLGLGATTVYFADKTADGGTPMNTIITIPAGGQTGASVSFQNSTTPYTLSSSDAIGINGAFSVSKVGGAAATLNGTHSYTGPTTVSAGTLNINGNNSLPGLVTVSAGATLNLTGANAFTGGFVLAGTASGPVTVGTSLSGAGSSSGAINVLNGTTLTPGSATFTPGTLALGALTLNGATTLNFDVGTTTTPGGGVNDLLAVAGGFTNTGTVTVSFNFNSGLPAIGVPYTIITSTALDPAFNPASFVGGPSHLTPTFSASGNNVQVTFAAGNNNVVWQGDRNNNTNWVPGTLGWTNLAGDGTLDFFYNADNARFDDTATNPVVNLPGPVFPASVLVTGTSNYVFAGAGGLAGAGALTKDGPGTLTLTNVNTFTGPTVVSAGTLRVNSAAAQPANSAISVSANAVLDLNVVSAGTVTWPATNALSGAGLVRVNTGSGANNIVLRNDLSGFTGLLDLIPAPSGKLNLSQMIAGPAPSATLRVTNGSTVFLASGRNLLCNVELYGGATGEAFGQLRIDSNTTNFGPILLRGNTTIGNQAGTASFGYINGVISDGGAGFGFTKQGNGAIVLSAANTFSGQTAFTAATTALQLNHINALAQSTVNLTVANGLTFNANAGPDFVLGGLIGNAALALQNTAGGAMNLSVGNNNASSTFSGALSGVGSFTKIGSGVLTLSGSSAHTGTTLANGGVLQLGAAGALTSTIQVGPAGTFDVSLVSGGFAVRANQNLTGFGVVTGAVTVPVSAAIAPGTLGTAGTLTFSNAVILNSGTLKFDLANATTAGGGVNDLMVMNGPLSLTGANIVQLNLLQGALAAGTYTLISGITSVPGGSAANVQLASPTRYGITFDFVDQAAPGVSGITNLIMSVSGASGAVSWVGTNGNWDAGVTFNWKNPGTLLPDQFFTFDQALFDDSLTGTPAVTLVGSLFPLGVNVSNLNAAYTFSGAGRISGVTGLTKDGAGTLSVGTANDYAGPTIIREGTLRTTLGTALGTVAGATYVTNSGTLDTFGQNLGNEPVVISGPGAGGNGTIRNSGADQTQTLTALALAGHATIGGPARWDVRGAGSSVDLAGFTLTKTGSNFVSFVSARVTNNGSIVVNQGQLGFEVATTVSGSGLVTINSAGMLNVGDWGSVLVVTKSMALNGGTLASATTGANGTCGIDSPISLLADSPVNVLSTATITLRGAVSGAGGLTKQGPGTLALSHTNTYQGLTAIDAGIVRLNATGSISNSTGVKLAPGTQLDASARGGVSFGQNQSLSGSGSVLGPVSATAGSRLVPGDLLLGTLALGNGLGLADVAQLDFQLGATNTEGAGVNDLIQITGNLALSGVSTVRVSVVSILDTNLWYTLFAYTGTLTGGNANLVVMSDTRYTFEVDATGVPGKVRVRPSGSLGNLLWVGGNPDNTWDAKTTANWDPGTGDPDVFFPGDAVSFVNGSSFPMVNLSGVLQPSDVNALADEPYVFEGTGRINGGRLFKSGSGTLTLANSAVNSFAAGTLINQGTLQIGNGGMVGAVPAGPLTNNATLALRRSDDLSFGGGIAGSGVLRKEGINTLTLTGPSGQGGGTVIAGGTVRLQNNGALGDLNTAVTTVNDGASLDLAAAELWSYALPLFIEGAGFGGAGAITKSVTGVQNLMQLRSLTLAADASIGGVTNARIDIGRGDWAGATVTAPLHLDGQGHTLSVVGGVYFGILAGAQNLAGLVIRDGAFVAPHADNSMGDATVTLDGGTLTPWGADHFFTNALVLNAGSIDNQGFSNHYAGPVQLNGAVPVNTLASGNITFSGLMSGPGQLTKGGPATLVLLGTNGHGGGTVVNAGTLRVEGVLGSGTGVVSIAGAQLTGNGTILDAVTVATNGLLAPGASIGVLTINKTLTLAGATFMEIDRANATNDRVRGLSGVVYGGVLVVTNLGGTLADGDTFQLFDAASYSGAFSAILLPPLSGGLAWRTSTLTEDGTIMVTVPNPESQRIEAFAFDAGTFTVTFAGLPNYTYRVQFATTLTPPADWTDLSTNTVPPSGLFQIIDSVTSTNRFYRSVYP